MIYQYKYLKIDLEELKEEKTKLIYLFENDFRTLLDKFNILETPEEIPDSVSICGRVKEVYKHLAKYVHPDKGGNVDKFLELNQYYKQNNLLGILSIGMDINVTVDINNEDLQLIENSLNEINTNIVNEKNTFAYLWNYGTKEQKANILDTLESKYNVKFTIDDLTMTQKQKLGLINT